MGYNHMGCTYIVMANVVIADIVIAYVVIVHTVMIYIGIACVSVSLHPSIRPSIHLTVTTHQCMRGPAQNLASSHEWCMRHLHTHHSVHNGR